MDTSGDSVASIALDLLLLATFGFVAVRMLRLARPRTVPVVAIVATIVVGVPSLLQFAIPAVGHLLRRDPAETLLHGQWWRPFTALLAQDGGLSAAIFNLVVVALATAASEWIVGRARTIVLLLLPSILVNLLALTWGATGGGSSFAVDGLMVAVVVRCAIRGADPLIRVAAVLPVASGVVLVLLDDAHGVAMLIGAALGALAAIRGRRPGR